MEDINLRMRGISPRINEYWCGFLLLLWFASHVSWGVSAWGADGHHMTCRLADPLLSPSAKDAVRNLLPDYAPDLASLCTWPDDIRHLRQWHWSSPLHFIDTPDFRCNYNYKRDCHNTQGEPDMCIAGAINNYTSQLLEFQNEVSFHSSGQGLQSVTTKHVSSYNLTQALLFLAHFVGDIHQPLHVGFTGDAGGNTIIVHWYRRKYNLHHIWDDEIINTAKERYYDSDISVMIDAISKNIDVVWSNETSDWTTCGNGQIACPDTYATESIKAACNWAYKNASPGSVLKDEYFLSRLPIVEKKLAQGGVRLAAILNQIFSQTSNI